MLPAPPLPQPLLPPLPLPLTTVAVAANATADGAFTIVFCLVSKIKRSDESALLPPPPSVDAVDDELDLVDSLPEILIGFDCACGVDGCDICDDDDDV